MTILPAVEPSRIVQNIHVCPGTFRSIVNMIIFSILEPPTGYPCGLGTPPLTVPRGIPNRLSEGRSAPGSDFSSPRNITAWGAA
jgi:hypothetical protein